MSNTRYDLNKSFYLIVSYEDYFLLFSIKHKIIPWISFETKLNDSSLNSINPIWSNHTLKEKYEFIKDHLESLSEYKLTYKEDADKYFIYFPFTIGKKSILIELCLKALKTLKDNKTIIDKLSETEAILRQLKEDLEKTKDSNREFEGFNKQLIGWINTLEHIN